MYRLIIFLHVASVIASVGPFFLLFPLLRKMRDANAELLDSYIDAFRIAVRLSKHSGHVLVTTGVLLMWIGGWSWLTSWILLTILIMVASLYFIARAFSPILRRLEKSHEVSNGDRNEDRNEDRNLLLRKLSQSLYLYVLIMFAMLWFMITKPNVW